MAPRFKKLTDCPENLREAIDWLIQVRHGGDGNGLEQLAKALKKLIAEAIERTYTSFCDNLCTILDPAGQRYECCREKIQSIKALKAEVDKAGIVEEDKLEILLNYVKTLKDGCVTNHRVDTSTDKALEDVQSRMENLEGLRKNLSGFTSDPSPILEQLCTGLETFLGFDPSSKGYNGNGIVYSDLDRLCDGMIAFLHGVLKGVHDNKNLSPYKEKLHDSVIDLDAQLSKGERGLNVVIDHVKSGIQGWLGAVKSSNYEVTRHINDLITEGQNIPKLLKELQDIKGKEYFEGVYSDWIYGVDLLPGIAEQSFNKLKTLDGKLSELLLPHIELIKRFVESYQDSFSRDVYGLIDYCSRVDNEFRTLDDTFEKGLSETNHGGLRYKLNDNITQLKDKVEKEYPRQLRISIEAAKHTLLEAKLVADAYLTAVYNNNERDMFRVKFDAIEGLLKEVNDKSSMPSKNKSQLRQLVTTVQQNLRQLNVELNKCASDIGRTISTAVSDITVALVQLDNKVKDDLVLLKNKIDGPIQEYFQTVDAGLKNAVKVSYSHSDFPQEFRIGIGGGKGDAKAPKLHKWAEDNNTRLQNALYKLDISGELPKFKTFVQEFIEIVDENQKTFFGAIGAEITGIVKKIVFNLYNANNDNIVVQNLMVNYIKWVTSAGDSTSLHSKIKKITTDLKNIFADGIVNEHSTFNTEVGGALNTYNVIKERANISVEELFEKIGKLEELPEAVKRARLSVDKFIKDIRKYYEALNTEVKIAISTLDHSLHKLDAMIRQVNFGIDDVHTKAKEYIQEFHDIYFRSSLNAKKNIKKEALSKFAESKEFALNKLKGLISERLKRINVIIEKDSVTGIKGMMKWMSGDLDASGRRSAENFLSKMKTELEKGDHITLLDLSKIARDFIDVILIYAGGDVKKVFTHDCMIMYRSKVKSIFDKFSRLLDTLTHYNADFSTNLAEFQNLLSDLNPHEFDVPAYPVLDILRVGLLKLCKELEKAYVNSYSGRAINWNRNDNTDKGNCAKVCLTSIHMLFNGLHEMFYKCARSYKAFAIDGSATTDENRYDLAKYLQLQGFNVDRLYKNKTGWDVAVKLGKGFNNNGGFSNPEETRKRFDVYMGAALEMEAPLSVLFRNLQAYCRVSHHNIATSTRYPSSIYEMLGWLAGLPYNPIFRKLEENCKSYYDVEKERHMVSKMHGLMAYDLTTVCDYSYNLLTRIAGFGDAATYYGCEYMNNSLNLHYMEKPSQCFDMLLDILRRLFHALRFLHVHCSIDKSSYGWGECRFGTGVQASDWHCSQYNDKLASGTADCSISSPLQLYFTDGLRGMLPHSIVSENQKLTCATCTKTPPSMPCLTPLGFRSFSGTTRVGKDLCDVLDKLCGDNGVFTTVYSNLSCLISRPPQSLPDIFCFFSHLTQSWKTMPETGFPSGDKSVQKSVCDKIVGTVACDYNDARKLLDSCRELYRSKSHNKHDYEKSPDIEYLIGCNKNGCGYLIQMLNGPAYSDLSAKHANKYLSWLTYICPSIVTFLEQLKNAYCNISCFESGCQGCHHEGKCLSGKHGTEECGCTSMVHCRGVLPVFYRYGLTYADASYKSKKRCYIFCKALDRILNSELLNNFLTAVDTFLWTIRKYFFYTLLSLWLLSLLYLLHIMVIRLDLLHIKSHLHSPSSHRIAAQSLLAAARLGKLAKLTYLQP
ncbi:hypothetical protein BBBOND_0305130 [Babesia bigemina]|uniref:C3H1-type domain-containing protein n=1 Tax=Babesia bigemina TaxID=5866 RepID=A0A061DDV6_BABBI|nr:hypothetical protein BBBOND_0305130 [Babesia bigemina]CDR96610.1 hypothetical protein BBBOND_0305130 [Babesia bigemina]|eukprot:XP_012768796.1 hypothetical protein BBBOND_0305130 [Babesia bigemina]